MTYNHMSPEESWDQVVGWSGWGGWDFGLS